MIDEQDLFDQDAREAPCVIEEGTAGWPGNPDVVDLGSASNDGMTLVRVTLYRGHPQGSPRADDDGANGYCILARLSAPAWDIPSRGARVVVLFPGGDALTPGNGVIVARPVTSPTRRFGRRKTILDYGDHDVVIVARSIALVSEDDGRHVISVSGQGGCQIVSDGSGLYTKGGAVDVKTVDEDGNLRTALVAGQNNIAMVWAVDPTNPSSVTLSEQGPDLVGQFVTVDFGTSMKLGKTASPATPVCLGPTGVSAVGSTRIWGAP